MIRVEILFRSGLAAGLLPVLAFAAEPQTAEEIVARYVQAIGGQQRLDAVQSMRLTGRTIADNGQESTFRMELKRPDKIRVEFTFMNMSGAQGYDGSDGWLLMPGSSQPGPMSAEMLVNVKDEAEMFGPLVDHAERGHAISLVGRETAAGAEAYRLKVALQNGRNVDYLIDAKTFLPLRRLEVRPEPEGEVIIEYAEFKDVDGVKLARSVRRTNRTQTRKVELDKVELNADLPDARFQRPSPGPGPAPSGGS